MKARSPLRCSMEIRRHALIVLLAVTTVCWLVVPAAFAQECAQCDIAATLEIPTSVPAGELVFRSQVNEVSVLFTAAQSGKFIADLSAQDITIRDDNKPPAAIVGFRTQRELPLRVALVIDTSDSVHSRFRFEQQAAIAFLRQAISHNGDLAFVVGFNNGVDVTQDFSGDHDVLSQGVQRLKLGGGTALYNAVYESCEKLIRHPEQDIVARVIVILSDGQNNSGTVTRDQAITAAEDTEVTIYSISTNFGATTDPDHQYSAEEGNSNLRKLAEQTGGRVLFPGGAKEVGKAFAKIGEELRSRYAISYRPADFASDGRYRKINIEAHKSGEKLHIRARKGYYAR
jgi:VWFA-related protein